MVKNANKLWDIMIGRERIFIDLDKDEAFSALFTVADHYDGVALYDGEIIGKFNG